MIACNELVTVRKDVPSGTIILHRPECRNAICRTMVDLLIEALEDFQQERKVRAIILTGSGNHFCSGTDLREIQQTRDESDAWEIWYQDVSKFQELIEKMLRFPKPIICAVSGAVMGTGVALAVASDMVVATHDAQFALPEGQRGLVPGLTAPLLSYRVGVGNAAKLLFTGGPMTAADAQQIGIVHELVDEHLLWLQAHEMAKQCAANSIQSMQLTKQLLNETVAEELYTQLSIGAANMATARTTDAAQQGVDAFLNKMPVTFE